MASPEVQPKWLIAGIAGALAAWGVFLALGAFFAPSDPGHAGDYRKLLVVAGMVLAFLLLWVSVLAVRARKFRQKRKKDDV